MHLDWWTVGLQTVNFAVLVWLLHRFLYKPVLGMIEARKADVQGQYDAAADAGEKAKAQLVAVQADRAGIAAEREAALKAATAQARDEAEAARARAERDARAMMDAGRKTLAAERERALDEARRAALDLGMDFARRLLADVSADSLADAWIDKIEKRIGTLGEPERGSLAAQLAGGRPLTVVTATPLAAATADVWRGRLRRALGSDVAVSFETDPALIAGAELHFPTANLRLSWRGALDAARAEMAGDADGR